MEQELLALSGIQHFAYCRRQWALIHIEQQWAENYFTSDGHVFHERVHDNTVREHRGDLLIVRGLPVASTRLGLSGICDAVEFRKAETGVLLHGEEGLWLPYPVEYKRGQPKAHDADALQLCAQAMALEEQLLCRIPEGSLYYGQPRRRQKIMFTSTLRQQVTEYAAEMHQLYARGYTPRAKSGKHCTGCSLREICLPVLQKRQSAADYLAAALEDAK